jgi:putative peptide zinc metalloprotease protein
MPIHLKLPIPSCNFHSIGLYEEKFSESHVTAEKIASDQLSLEEMSRRRGDLAVRAGMNGIFVSELPPLSSGFHLNKGQRTGEVVSPEIMLYAYSTDREISKLQVGDEATVYLQDIIAGYPARITAINSIAAQLKNSPLLQHFGGPIPVYIDESAPSGSYSSVQTLYRVELAFQEMPEMKAGRVATVKIHHSEQLYNRVKQFVLSILRREF